MTNSSAVGGAGERWASALLTTALCAETAHATLSEDYDKVDLKVSFVHAFTTGARVTAHCQIKSGDSFLASADRRAFKLKNITSDTIKALRAGTRPALLVWVAPSPRTAAFWYSFGTRLRDATPLKIPRWQRISPALRYDLTRVHEQCSPARRAVRLDVSDSNMELGAAKEAYRALQRVYQHPLAGAIHVSRLGWRHITRKSKPKERRQQSFRLIPYLPHFLECTPDRFSTICDPIVIEGRSARRRSWTWCWYRNALRIGGKPHRLLVRFREEIRYPENWIHRPLALGDVKQTAILESWWAKPERERQ